MSGSANGSGLVNTGDMEGTNEDPNTHPSSFRSTPENLPLVGLLRQQEALVAARLATATTTANDLEAQVNKLTDQLWDLVKERAAEINALKKANDSLRRDVEEWKTRYQISRYVVRSGRRRRASMIAEARNACKEAARALDSFIAREDSRP
ncbi:hypothetical protein SLS62_007804 [Diatrype stigma]|uniref:Uncharacterized protein n=1 Tax=Diatrype stigma TaxID=117547 RepID=A0AAN9YPZ9_9PEZI